MRKSSRIRRKVVLCILHPRAVHAVRVGGRLEVFPLLLIFMPTFWKRVNI